jgi:uncharacterized protein (TIGR00290 family)
MTPTGNGGGRAAILWTGGKDCALAMDEAQRRGQPVSALVTFAPRAATFRAHPLEIMRRQGLAAGLPHLILEVQEPYDQGYRAAIERLRDREGIDTLITGDIDRVAGLPNWVAQCCEGTGVAVRMPLWQRPREQLLDLLLRRGFTAIFSCVKRPWFTPDWLGRPLDAAAMEDLRTLRAATGLDLCGEQGEYHTIVTAGPILGRPVPLPPWQAQIDGDLMVMRFAEE